MNLVKTHKQPVWYRILQISRTLAYLISLGFATVISLGQSSYTYTNYANNTLVTVPDKPFQWLTFLATIAVSVVVIEVLESAMVYVFSGKDVSSSLHDKYSKFTKAIN